MKDANAKAIIITSLQSPSELFTGERLVLSVVGMFLKNVKYLIHKVASL